jgi:hypothetical protein
MPKHVLDSKYYCLAIGSRHTTNDAAMLIKDNNLKLQFCFNNASVLVFLSLLLISAIVVTVLLNKSKAASTLLHT